MKRNKTKKETIVIIKNINNIHNDSLLDIILDYENQSVIYIDDKDESHTNFFDILIGLNNLVFNWNKNKFSYRNSYKKLSSLNTKEKQMLTEYLELKTDPFIDTDYIFCFG